MGMITLISVTLTYCRGGGYHEVLGLDSIDHLGVSRVFLRVESFGK